MIRRPMLLFCLLLTFALLVPMARAQETTLGRLEFPTSGSPEAQKHFLRGVLALHSFWYEEAVEAFRAATKADPGFAMGYWGEAMALNHPVWGEQDTDGARKVLAKIPANAKLTPREQAWMGAVRALYGEGEKPVRDKAHLAAMAEMYRQWPDDLEVASFYSLAILAVHGYQKEGHEEQVRAGAIALDVLAKNPDHPGAAHYTIHAFDNPVHAILALPAASRYAKIAPEAHHARHMPSHIFIQRGMWPEAAASNESAWEASENWVKRKNLSGALRDFHSLHWAFYIYLQQGRYAKAREVFAFRQKTLADAAAPALGAERSSSNWRHYPDMAAEYVMEMEDWAKAAELFDDRGVAVPSEAGAHAAHGAPAGSYGGGQQSRAEVLAAFIRGYAAAGKDARETEKRVTALREKRKQADANSDRARALEIMELMILARASAAKKSWNDAIEKMTRAVKLEEEMAPPSGPPDLIKPSHELYGEILTAAGKAKEAAAQFAVALDRQPNRARSLLGAARAAVKSGDEPAAVVAYSKLLEIWKGADAQLAELREARAYVDRGTRAGIGASSQK